MKPEIYTPSFGGYQVMHRYEGWRIAYLTYAEIFDKITYLEKHNETDEIFVLLEGSAELIFNEDRECMTMEKDKIYNVPKGMWHNVKVSRDAVLLIFENENTSKENSDYIYFE